MNVKRTTIFGSLLVTFIIVVRYIILHPAATAFGIMLVAALFLIFMIGSVIWDIAGWIMTYFE
jgi:hypothetical protein